MKPSLSLFGPASTVHVNTNDEKTSTAEAHDLSDSDSEIIDKGAQLGVQKAEATTQAWNKASLIAAYLLIWLIYFITALQSSVISSLTPYITSAFQEHSLTALTGVFSSLIGGLIKLPLAKVLDIWGRAEGFAIMVVCLTVGIIMMAVCNNVQTYAAAQVFYWVGYNGIGYATSIFIADTSSLKNRGFAFAFVSSPYIITVWIGGPLATAVLNGVGFRWGFGVFAIVIPVICAPLYFLFVWNYRKAKKSGLIPLQHENNRSLLQSTKYYLIQFDVVGLLLICAGLALFLLPFSIFSYKAKGWQSPMIICMLVFGFLLCVAFALYEKFIAPVSFIPFALLMDRTVMGANILAAVLFVAFYIWDSYFQSFLQVVNNLSITEASYVVNIYSIGSCFWALVIGVYIRVTGRFKNIALYFGVPFTILGVGLMIRFRQPNHNVGFIVMCQIFYAFAGGTLVICEQLAAMAATDHQHVAVVLALEGMFSQVGGAIGSTVAAAVWTGTFPERLLHYLPAETQAESTAIYASLVTQLSYPVGSSTRIAVQQAYGDSQKYMLIGATAILVLAIPAVAVWRDIDVKKNKQVKGMVF